MAKSGSVESACIVNAGVEKKKIKKKGLVYRSTAIFPSELTKVRSSLACDLFCFCVPFRFFKLVTSAAAPSLIIGFIIFARQTLRRTVIFPKDIVKT